MAWAGIWCLRLSSGLLVHICILVRSRMLFASIVILDLCIVSFVLDSVSRCCIYDLLWVPSRTVVMLSQFHPHNVCVATCTLCLVGVLGSLLRGFGWSPKVCIVPILGRYRDLKLKKKSIMEEKRAFGLGNSWGYLGKKTP